jgi:hypothetical protein
VINLHEDGPDPDRYLLSIWLQHGTPHGLVGRGLMTHDDQPLTIDEIPGYIGTHLRRVVGGQLGPIGPLTIEFVVPYYLLNGSFDQFRIMLDGPQTLGSAHPLVLRSLDRLHRDVIHHRWRTRWLWLDTHQHEFDHRATKFINLQGTAVDDELQQHNDYSTEIPVCLVLAARGRGRADAALINAIKDSLDLGMPVVLWCRAPRLNQQFLAEMSNQLHGRPLVEIPAMVQRMRQLAARSDNSSDQVGANISLLWDEAVRLPLTDAFRAPPREDYQ